MNTTKEERLSITTEQKDNQFGCDVFSLSKASKFRREKSITATGLGLKKKKDIIQNNVYFW